MKKQWLNSILAGLGLAGAVACDVRAADPRTSLLYEMITETGMPHLEENLRYAVRKETRCMSPRELSTAFWMLRDVSLHDCALVKATEEADSALYSLKCTGGHGTTGTAIWQLAPDVIRGTLNVRLGGKNMTFYQRITAKHVGDCP